MDAGKCASQAGHAFLDAYLCAHASDSERCAAYRAVRHGVKVVLIAEGERLLFLFRKARRLGLPCALVIDEGCPDFFGGEPILTAFGAGPLTRREASKLLGGIPLLSSLTTSSTP
jgi:peptidyl-tRNA hydrolase